jgi:hypothetical protein
MNVKWIKPRDLDEHDEVTEQLMWLLQRKSSNVPSHLLLKLWDLLDPSSYKTELSRAKVETIKKDQLDRILKQPDQGNLDMDFDKLSQEKRRNVTRLFQNKNPSVTMPIFLCKKNHWWLLAGNTRTAYCYKNKIELQAVKINY